METIHIDHKSISGEFDLKDIRSLEQMGYDIYIVGKTYDQVGSDYQIENMVSRVGIVVGITTRTFKPHEEIHGVYIISNFVSDKSEFTRYFSTIAEFMRYLNIDQGNAGRIEIDTIQDGDETNKA